MTSILANDLPILKSELNKALTEISQRKTTRLMDYEAALKNTIEEFYPERYWWEVTQCDIHAELFGKDGLYYIVEKIMNKITLCD
jgi:hypothetical protein